MILLNRLQHKFRNIENIIFTTSGKNINQKKETDSLIKNINIKTRTYFTKQVITISKSIQKLKTKVGNSSR